MATFEAIASTTLSSTSSVVTFSSIPSTYRHLQLRMTLRDTFASTYTTGPFLRFNGDSSTNYDHYNLESSGSSASTTNNNSATHASPSVYPASSLTAGIFGFFIVDITDYGSANKFKQVHFISGSDGSGSGYTTYGGASWLSTSAITSMSITAGNTFAIGSTFSLYGLRSS